MRRDRNENTLLSEKRVCVYRRTPQRRHTESKRRMKWVRFTAVPKLRVTFVLQQVSAESLLADCVVQIELKLCALLS